MVTAHERARAELVSQFQVDGETADLQARCDASGVTLAEVRAWLESAVFSASTLRVDRSTSSLMASV